MGSFYYPSFDVIRIAADGSRVELPAETINVYNVTAASSLGTLVTDAYGIIEAGSFTADLFDVIEISHATYPLTCRFTLQVTAEDAFTAVENDISAYIAENLYTDTTESKAARMYIVDLDNTARRPEYAAEIKPGVESQIHIPQTSVAQNLRLTLVSQDIEGQFSTSDILTAPEYFDITIPALTLSTSIYCLFDHFTDATTATTGEETLYIDQIDAGRLAVNGDKVTAEYGGTSTPGNSQSVEIAFAGTDIPSTLTIDAGDHWSINVTIIRENASAVRCRVVYNADGLYPDPQYARITGLDLDNTDYDIELKATTSDAAGDVIAKMGHGLFIPAASTGTDWVTYLGEIVTYGGDEVSS